MIDEALGIALELVRRWEGLRLRPYLCPAGRATIGYGSTVYPDGRRVTLTDHPIDRETADAIARHDLSQRLSVVLTLCPGIDTGPRLGAILDFSYNLGLANLRASTLRRRINAGQWEDVPAQIMRWRFAGGRELRGLMLRRADEARLVA